MKKQDEEDVEKIIQNLLSLISQDYNCACYLSNNSSKKFFLYSYVKDYANKDCFCITPAFMIKWSKDHFIIKDYFISLNEMLQTFLDPNYKFHIYDRNIKFCSICVAKKYGSTIEQLKITFDLRAIT